MKTKSDKTINAQQQIIDQQDKTIERLSKELEAREKHIEKLYERLYGTQQTYINIAEILKTQNQTENTQALQ